MLVILKEAPEATTWQTVSKKPCTCSKCIHVRFDLHDAADDNGNHSACLQATPATASSIAALHGMLYAAVCNGQLAPIRQPDAIAKYG